MSCCDVAPASKQPSQPPAFVAVLPVTVALTALVHTTGCEPGGDGGGGLTGPPPEPPALAIIAFCTPAPSVHTDVSRTSGYVGACVLVCFSTPFRKYFTAPPST